MTKALLLLICSCLSSFGGTWYFLEFYPWAYDVDGQRWLFLVPSDDGLLVTEDGSSWWTFGDAPAPVVADYAPTGVEGASVGFKSTQGLTDGRIDFGSNNSFMLTNQDIISGLLVNLVSTGTYTYQKDSPDSATAVLSIEYYRATYAGESVEGTPAQVYDAYSIRMATTIRSELNFASGEGGRYNITESYYGTNQTNSASEGFYLIDQSRLAVQ